MTALNMTKQSTSPFQKTTQEVTAELRWQGSFDPDVFAFALNGQGLLVDGEQGCCYFNGKNIYNGAIIHLGDARNGDSKPVGEADEILKFRLNDIPAHIETIVIAIALYNAPISGQKFGQMREMSITILEDGRKSMFSNLAEDHGDKYSLVVSEFHRDTNGWKMKVIGEAGLETLDEMFKRYMGVDE
jgi:tellurium resistance protein TerD